jgi:hypothetical protein
MVVLTVIIACSDNPPEIGDVQWQVILFQNRLLGATYQKLSVFVRGSDKDGQTDLEALHIINDDAQLYWSLQSDRWEKATIRGSEWFGSNGLTLPGGRPLPIGTYRILLEDLSGKIAQSQIYIKRDNIETANAQFPGVDFIDNRIQVGGNFIDPEIWVYDSNDQFLFRVTLTEKSIDIKNITSRNSALESGFSYYIYAKQSGVYYGVLIGPFYYSRS